MYAKIINEETKQCEVGIGTNTDFYQSIGMTDMKVEQAYDGCWYVKGYAPQKSQELMEQEVRAVRNSYLEKYVDGVVSNPLRWADMNEEEQGFYTTYRRYLLNYPQGNDWWLNNPMTFDEWKDSI